MAAITDEKRKAMEDEMSRFEQEIQVQPGYAPPSYDDDDDDDDDDYDGEPVTGSSQRRGQFRAKTSHDDSDHEDDGNDDEDEIDEEDRLVQRFTPPPMLPPPPPPPHIPQHTPPPLQPPPPPPPMFIPPQMRHRPPVRPHGSFPNGPGIGLTGPPMRSAGPFMGPRGPPHMGPGIYSRGPTPMGQHPGAHMRPQLDYNGLPMHHGGPAAGAGEVVPFTADRLAQFSNNNNFYGVSPAMRLQQQDGATEPTAASLQKEKTKVVYSAAPVRNIQQSSDKDGDKAVKRKKKKKLKSSHDTSKADNNNVLNSQNTAQTNIAAVPQTSNINYNFTPTSFVAQSDVPIQQDGSTISGNIRADISFDQKTGEMIQHAGAAAKGKKEKKERKKKYMRSAGGSTWEDQTLGEWDQDDFRLFCGDLGNEVSDDVLIKAFNKYPSFQKARVIRDKKTSKTKGFGFVSFRDPNDFMKAMREMNGKYVGNRPIKLRKSTWRDRATDAVRRKEKEKKMLGFK